MRQRWGKWILALAIGLIATLVFAVAALADAPSSASDVAIKMQGQAAMVNGYQSSQLRLKTSSADSSAWLLEIALNPLSVKSNNANNPVWNVTGNYTLGISGQPLSTGTASGWVDSNGAGDVLISDKSTGTSLDLSFGVGYTGSVSATARGQWPSLPVQNSSQTSTPTQPVNHFFWYLSRSSGILAYLLLFVNLFLGIGLKARYLDKILNRWRSLDLHQITAITAMALIFLHIFSILGDSYLKFGLKELLVPGASPYRPFWDALGIIGFYVLLAVTFSCYIRKYIGQAVWKGLHYTSFVLFFIILAHSIKSGTDITAPWMQWVYLATGTIMAFLFLLRFMGSRTNNVENRMKLKNA